MHFSEKVYTLRCTMASGKAPRSWGVFENFCVKSNLAVCLLVLLLTVDYRKIGEQDVLVAAPIILLGSNCCPLFPRLSMKLLDILNH